MQSNLPLSALTELLALNPLLNFAAYDRPERPRRFTCYTDSRSDFHPLTIPAPLSELPYDILYSGIFAPLIAPASADPPANRNQQCQDEPIQLGTQVQPAGANWLGTAGSPAKWKDVADRPRWGFLTNAHVLSDQPHDAGRAQHQPTVDRPLFARLSRSCPAKPDVTNRVDCAVADSLVDGKHTTSHRILALPPPSDRLLDAHVGLRVLKVGRTTSRTAGLCIATGASVAVHYPDFLALFEDQDIYTGNVPPFSAAGDSGSLIVAEQCVCPTSLLFAGNPVYTAANPIRHVAAALDLLYPFP